VSLRQQRDPLQFKKPIQFIDLSLEAASWRFIVFLSIACVPWDRPGADLPRPAVRGQSVVAPDRGPVRRLSLEHSIAPVPVPWAVPSGPGTHQRGRDVRTVQVTDASAATCVLEPSTSQRTIQRLTALKRKMLPVGPVPTPTSRFLSLAKVA
jgi:hypothetical protein